MQLPDALRALLFRPHTQLVGENRVTGGSNPSERIAFLMLIDGILVFLVILGTAIVVPTLSRTDLPGIGAEIGGSSYWNWFPLAVIGGWWIFASLHDLYDVSSLHRRIPTAARVVLASLTSVAACFLVTLLLPVNLGAEILLYFLGAAIPLLIVWRLAYISVSTMPMFSHRTLIVGKGERARRASELVKQHAYLNCQVMGYISDTAEATEPTIDGLPVLSNPAELPKWVREARVHEIVIATESTLDHRLFLSLIECQAHGTQIIWLPDLYERFRQNIPIDQVDPQWVLHAVQFGPDLLQRSIKRLLDLVLVLLTLPVLLIFIPLVAIAIKLDSPGPVFYRQVRCGRSSKHFMIYKFRTMYTDAEKDGRARWATKGDPRITRVGRLLRKTRLDELPQVINILRGEMSIVGPRPERPEFVDELKQVIPYYHTRLLVKPGLTGWAQVQFDYTSTVEDTVTKVQYDLYYIHRWTLWLDIYIIFRTVGVVLKLKGM